MKRRLFFALAILVLLAASAAAYYLFTRNGSQPVYKYSKIERGPLTAVVSASGTLNPVVSVQVGSQVSGQIKEILVDFNAPVTAGQLIARIDPETFQQKVRQAEADVDAARSAVNVQRAQQLQAQVSQAEAQRDFDRKTLLVEKKFISPAERDKAQSAVETAKAQAQVADAQAKNSEAQVRQRAAQLAQARVDLDRTAIRSPVDGIVVKRSVDTGQTVAASLQAPELFVIAKNLTDMQVETSIDEADVGRVRIGQKAAFTVDAFPGRNFEGEVRQVRKAALVVSNVVTYTIIVSAANPELTLLPGMTANVRIVAAQKDNVLKIPNAALRFKPAGAAAEAKPTAEAKPAAGQGAGGNSQLKEHLAKELELDASQQAKLDAILEGMRDKFAAARDLPEAERAKARERNRAEQREKIVAILTEPQKKRYAEMNTESQANRGSGTGSGGGSGRVWILGGDGQPKAVPVRLGITDGTATELVSGELTETSQVIVGTASAATKPASGAPAGPRMF